MNEGTDGGQAVHRVTTGGQTYETTAENLTDDFRHAKAMAGQPNVQIRIQVQGTEIKAIRVTKTL